MRLKKVIVKKTIGDVGCDLSHTRNPTFPPGDPTWLPTATPTANTNARMRARGAF
jgi:hypothetical protein